MSSGVNAVAEFVKASANEMGSAAMYDEGVAVKVENLPGVVAPNWMSDADFSEMELGEEFRGEITETVNVFVDRTYGGLRVSLSLTVIDLHGSAGVIAVCVVEIV